MTRNDVVQELPKIDLHRHLDGAIRTSTISELARENDVELPAYEVDELNDHVQVSKDCRSLSDFLECFEVLYPTIQTPEALHRIAYEMCEDLSEHNVIYAETRFAPILMTEQGATQREIIDAALDGLREGTDEFGVQVNLILCIYRGTPPEESVKTVDLADEFRGDGVVGIDLAGDESQHGAREHSDAFDIARDGDLPITIHAGEAGEAGNIREALELGAQRIGHGVRLIDDPDLLDEVVEREIPLEICLTSNVQTQVVSSYEAHPVKMLRQKGVPITLNTDDPAISNIDINHEFQVASEKFHFTIDDLKSILMNSVEAAFADPTTKESLRSTLDEIQT